MPVLVRINGQKAILRDGAWRCADPHTERRLNVETESWIHLTGGPPLMDPDPERSVAEYIAPRFGGRIVLRIPAKRDDSRRIYTSRRQMSLFGPPAG